MGCGSSGLRSGVSLTSVTPAGIAASGAAGGVPPPGHSIRSHPNASLVIGGDGTASAREKRLTERPKRGSLTFGDEQAAAERAKEAAALREQQKRDKELAAALMEAAAASAAEKQHGVEAEFLPTHTNEHTHPHHPHPHPHPALTVTAGADDATDGGDSDSSDSSDSCSDDDGDDDDDDGDTDLEEIEEEALTLPVDDGVGGMTSPAMAARSPLAPSARPTPAMLQRGNTLHKLVKNFAPENAHILIVDDDSPHMEMVARWLAAKHYHVTLCNDGEEAVEVLSASFSKPNANDETTAAPPLNSPPAPAPSDSHVPPDAVEQSEDFDLILSDSAMESPEGTPLLDWVLRHDQTKHIPFVLMSVDATSQSCDRSLRRGAEDFFSKPLQRNVLLKTFRTILEQRTEQRNSARLKQWGDKYKKQLLAEKVRKETLGMPIALAPTLSPYASMSTLDSPYATPATATTPSSALAATPPSSSHGTSGVGVGVIVSGGVGGSSHATTTTKSSVLLSPPSTAPSATTPDDSPPSTIVKPHPELIHHPARKALQILVPPHPGSGQSSPVIGGVGGSTLFNGVHNLPAVTPLNLVATPPIEQADEERATVDKATVLLVEPSESIQHALAQWLESINYTLLVQSSMPAALDFIRSTLPPPIEPPPVTGGVVGSHAMKPPLARSATNFTAKSNTKSKPTLQPMATIAIDSSPGTNRAARSTGTHIDLIIADAEPWSAGSEPPDLTGDAVMLRGSDFMSSIQSCSSSKNIPVMLLYHSSTGPDVAESIRQGVEAILVKPISKDMLLKKVNQVLTMIAQKRKSDMYAERAQAYRAILSSFRANREEEVRTGKRSPMTLQKRLSATRDTNNASTQAESPLARKHKPILLPGAMPPSSLLAPSPAAPPSASPPTALLPSSCESPTGVRFALDAHTDDKDQSTPSAAPPSSTSASTNAGDPLARVPKKRTASHTFTFDVAPTPAHAKYELHDAHAQEETNALASVTASHVVTGEPLGLPPTKPKPPVTVPNPTASATPPRESMLPPISASGRSSPAFSLDGARERSASVPSVPTLPSIRTGSPTPPLSLPPATITPINVTATAGVVSSSTNSPAGRHSPSVGIHRIHLRRSSNFTSPDPPPAPTSVPVPVVPVSVPQPPPGPPPTDNDGISSLTRKGSTRIKFIIKDKEQTRTESPTDK